MTASIRSCRFTALPFLAAAMAMAVFFPTGQKPLLAGDANMVNGPVSNTEVPAKPEDPRVRELQEKQKELKNGYELQRDAMEEDFKKVLEETPSSPARQDLIREFKAKQDHLKSQFQSNLREFQKEERKLRFGREDLHRDIFIESPVNGPAKADGQEGWRRDFEERKRRQDVLLQQDRMKEENATREKFWKTEGEPEGEVEGQPVPDPDDVQPENPQPDAAQPPMPPESNPAPKVMQF
ncbi:MAG: hypothetical protein Q8Q08_06035 [Candidatus Omnitrophota bacterium]|nr:hypothetical protein [Candidatus Omnitrophota bacterium]MDZ4242017.1 hypothetical protein [Candidatus Omnitrophota bacterium]